MKKNLIILFLTVFTLVSAFADDSTENTALPLSDNYIRITQGNYESIFRLYDTTAAEDLYVQLPLTLNVRNFANAQWMFFPPRPLRVTSAEAYHDGKKGELSYYEPWADVFLLYKDFVSGDEMHRIGIAVKGADDMQFMDKTILIEKYTRR